MDPSSLEIRLRDQLATLVDGAARAHGEDPATAGLLVALSGGPDSVALLAIAASWARQQERRLVAAHFDHRLRGSESEADRRFCEQLCEQSGLELVSGHGDPRAVARQRGRGLEDAARELRHRFLESERARLGLTAIATGHHRDDQAETVVLRLFRGTGLDGLRGLRPRRGRVIHPLLTATRAELLTLLDARGLRWRHDPSNDDGSNRRGRVRRELLPLVRDIFGPGSELAPARLAELLEGDLALLEELTARTWQQLAGPPLEGHAGASLDAAGTADLPTALARRVLRRWLQDALPRDLALAHVDDVLAWLRGGQSGTGLDLPGPVRLERIFARVGIVGVAPPQDDPTRWRLDVTPLDAVPSPVPAPVCAEGTWRLIGASDTLQGTLRLRAPRPGDRLQPFGLAGSKKLSDLVQERKIPTARRASLLVVEDDAGIVWVPGVVQAERTRVLPSTRQTVTISVKRRREQPGE